jgi:hypothetical protein
MIELILFSILLFALLWPFFIYLGVMNFSKDPNTMEDHLPGRPARRTIGRKNEDVSKSIGYIFVGHALVSIALFALLDFSDLLPGLALTVIAWVAMAVAMFTFSPANRMIHAYANLGHIAVVHLVCMVATFLLVVSIVFGVTINPEQATYIFLMALGGMMTFSGKPNAPKKKQKNEDAF